MQLNTMFLKLGFCKYVKHLKHFINKNINSCIYFLVVNIWKNLKLNNIVFTIVFFNSYGANWYFLENCQKLYLIYLIQVNYYQDMKELAILCKFSM